jgi:hypothetical protein
VTRWEKSRGYFLEGEEEQSGIMTGFFEVFGREIAVIFAKSTFRKLLMRRH